MQCGHDPLYDIDPRTGADIEVFYADRELETFGGCGAGWFWCSRQRGHSPAGAATGLVDGTARPWPTYKVNADQRGHVDLSKCGILAKYLILMVPRGGIEPPTLRFSVACSTN